MDQHNAPLKKALREQSEVEWTFISLGWVTDYIVPSTNRNHPSPGPLHPLDLDSRTMNIPGTGKDVFSTTSARDVTKAIAELLKSKNKWRPYTYVQAMETTWLQLAELVKPWAGCPTSKCRSNQSARLRRRWRRTSRDNPRCWPNSRCWCHRAGARLTRQSPERPSRSFSERPLAHSTRITGGGEAEPEGGHLRSILRGL